MARYETDGITKIVEKSNPNEDMMRGAFIAAMLIPREKKSKDPTRKSHTEGEARMMPLTHIDPDTLVLHPVTKWFARSVYTAGVAGLCYVGLMLAGFVH